MARTMRRLVGIGGESASCPAKAGSGGGGGNGNES